MDLSQAPHNWHKRQFQKRATNISISNSCIGALALLPCTVFKRWCSSGCMRTGGTIKSLPHYLRVKPTFRSERGKKQWERSEPHSPGFYGTLCWSAYTVRPNLPHLGGIPHWAGRGMTSPAVWCLSVQGTRLSLSSQETLYLGEMIKYHIAIFVCLLSSGNEILSHYIR
jgi:hypothetical protein